jgi:hypothetical protein
MKTIKISAKEDERGELLLDSERRHKIWLVWSFAEYKNGIPMLDLRAVATSEKQAEEYKGLLEKDFLNDKRILRSWNLKTDIKITIEERITNHCYGLSMSLLDNILYPER